jgi:Leucine-rich repeat (LRR) protein
MLKHFDSLKKIHIFSEGIKDYNDLGKLTQLEILILEDTIFNKKSDLKWLNNLVNLRELKFICTTIKEISYLDNLVNLEKLVINGCEDSGWRGYISEIKGLDNLLNLTDLNLSLNRITEIKGLNNLSKLKYIDLSENNIWEIRDISNFKNLKRLKLVGNPIKNLP